LQASVRLMPSTMLYSGRSADQIHLIVSMKAVPIKLLLLLFRFVVIVAHYYYLTVISFTAVTTFSFRLCWMYLYSDIAVQYKYTGKVYAVTV